MGKKLSIRPLGESDLIETAVICAEAMLNNPIHARVFGKRSLLRKRRLKRFFPGLLGYVHRKGILYGAFSDGCLVGVLGMLPPSRCKPSLYEVLRLLPSLITSNSLLGSVRLAIWLSTWAKIDPAAPHWHIGPLAVDAAWQKQGIGTQLIKVACEKGMGMPLYLETDKLSNVELYEGFGFSTIATPIILGVPSWVMWRQK